MKTKELIELSHKYKMIEIEANAYVCVKCLRKAKISNPGPITTPNSPITQSNS